jgi:hypothetical protein
VPYFNTYHSTVVYLLKARTVEMWEPAWQGSGPWKQHRNDVFCSARANNYTHESRIVKPSLSNNCTTTEKTLEAATKQRRVKTAADWEDIRCPVAVPKCVEKWEPNQYDSDDWGDPDGAVDDTDLYSL